MLSSVAGQWSCVRVVFLRPLTAARKLGRDVVEEARDRWVTVGEGREAMRVRACGGYVALLSEWLSSDEALLAEVMDALSKPLSSVEELIEAWSAVDGGWREAELEVCSDGVVRTPYRGLYWFHGQEEVNRLLKRWGARLVRDYDGMTRAEAVVGRPITSESLERGVRLIAFLLNLYTVIERIQAAEALRVTLSMLGEVAGGASP